MLSFQNYADVNICVLLRDKTSVKTLCYAAKQPESAECSKSYKIEAAEPSLEVLLQIERDGLVSH